MLIVRNDEYEIDWSEVFLYLETGELAWARTVNHNAKRYDVAGTLRGDGYVGIYYCGKYYFAHRVIYTMHYGAIPADLQIDHTDGNRSNNCITNLRLATASQNSVNQKIRSDNKSGYKGVCWHKQKQKWQVQIALGPGLRNKHLGFFKDLEEAAAAYLVAAKALHKEFFKA